MHYIHNNLAAILVIASVLFLVTSASNYQKHKKKLSTLVDANEFFRATTNNSARPILVDIPTPLANADELGRTMICSARPVLVDNHNRIALSIPRTKRKFISIKDSRLDVEQYETPSCERIGKSFIWRI